MIIIMIVITIIIIIIMIIPVQLLIGNKSVSELRLWESMNALEQCKSTGGLCSYGINAAKDDTNNDCTGGRRTKIFRRKTINSNSNNNNCMNMSLSAS